MARKAKETNLDIRNLVTHHWLGDEGRIEDRPEHGRKKVLNLSEEHFIVQNVKQNPRINASQINIELQHLCNKTVSNATVRRMLRKNSYNGRTPRRKQPYATAVNRKKKDFARTFISRSREFWRDVTFCNESKFNISGFDGHIKV
ncbi:PREDICTED: uncharacterized protein LOC108554552 [Eufriesea mexicana]|uniref:uncharacterized protein LOC108554552 n=1 Tax=Eufriesea mexicana TaxID=516756 RepID=UPI00083BCCD2|nr:PREDICTED: uncharacterized protein LOC108554552 [Eufriesea mexicana]